MKKTILLTVIFFAVSISVFGQEAGDVPNAPDFTDETQIILDDTAAPADTVQAGDTSFFTTWDFIKVILILVAVILIVYAVFYALKKAGGNKFQSDELIRLLGSQSLTQNGSVHLIEVGAKYYLVGCGESSVSHIADIDDKETIDEIMLKNPPPVEGHKSFSDFLNLKFGKNSKSSPDLQDKLNNNNKFMHDQAERLKKM